MFNQLKVLELASVLAGPGVGQFFAELGADVIKVENVKTKGDVTRSWKLPTEEDSDISGYFSAVNWGKRSIGLDISQSEGLTIVHELVKQTDIVVASYKPGDAEKLNVDYNTLKALKPDLIYGQITGYGPDNPKVGYDAVIQAESGFMYMNGEASGAPTKMPVALVDVLAAHHLKEGLLVALINRMSKGEGALVEVSLLQAAVSSLANQATNWLVGGVIPKRKGSEHPNIAPYGDVFTTADSKSLILAVGSDKQFAALCKIIDQEQLVDDPRFYTNHERVKNRKLLKQLLKTGIEEFELEELAGLLEKDKIPYGRINNIQEVFEQPEARTLLLENTLKSIKGVRTFATRSQNLENFSHFAPPPHFGEHTDNILTAILGFDTTQINDLRAQGIIF
ncbi:MAG: CaiB/BaiF CoA-transferase family protein [Bacteroidota bacterium]